MARCFLYYYNCTPELYTNLRWLVGWYLVTEGRPAHGTCLHTNCKGSVLNRVVIDNVLLSHHAIKLQSIENGIIKIEVKGHEVFSLI